MLLSSQWLMRHWNCSHSRLVMLCAWKRKNELKWPRMHVVYFSYIYIYVVWQSLLHELNIIIGAWEGKEDEENVSQHEVKVYLFLSESYVKRSLERLQKKIISRKLKSFATLLFKKRCMRLIRYARIIMWKSLKLLKISIFFAHSLYVAI